MAHGGGKMSFKIGCNGRGAQASSIDHPVSLEEASIDEQFRLVKETGVFDYFEITAGPRSLARRFAGRDCSPSMLARPVAPVLHPH